MFALLSLNGASGETGLWLVGILSVNVFHMGLRQHGVGVKLPSKCPHFQFYFRRPGATTLQLVLATSSIHLFAYYKVKGVELLQCRLSFGAYLSQQLQYIRCFSGLQIPDKWKAMSSDSYVPTVCMFPPLNHNLPRMPSVSYVRPQLFARTTLLFPKIVVGYLHHVLMVLMLWLIIL